ncbi:cupin domain-containing protein [Pantoea sp. B65]|uniref:cupin domain-containing protein n=1 Tax=Pantoea sp. B65 TaxID=2813359 RepID=UPI0039B3FBB7
MFPSTSNLLLLMSFSTGTFAAGASGNPQHLMLATPSNGIPNNLLPLIIYPSTVPDVDDIAAYFTTMFTYNGWPPNWRDQVFPYSHYHSNSHELLGICAGWAEILFGGESGRMVTLHAGDAVLIPAGVGHQQVAASDDFFAIGAYPEGMLPDTLIDDKSKMAQAIENIKRVPMPHADPITGGFGAVTDIWHPLAKSARSAL